MAEFLSSSERASIASNLLDLHDTFGRDIVVYKEAQKVIISTDPSYNYLYNTASSANKTIENAPAFSIFRASLSNFFACFLVLPSTLNLVLNWGV